ncbi:hypothetical protein Vadar_008419 [Vaccinium darrowii]|uniref:Uncharacterized protein n=1 Tax=Vaccinium darrowii TaxID=229202 RepID=A0ACB7YTX6_9ERIC|nr:hypothetical protein Vadar_008419 [Vaccinium darrowii]
MKTSCISIQITSSSEKMKLELQKATNEFKTSKSDWIYSCSSGELTTKIKHLSTALHKKDKHSQKGLQATVQKEEEVIEVSKN